MYTQRHCPRDYGMMGRYHPRYESDSGPADDEFKDADDGQYAQTIMSAYDSHNQGDDRNKKASSSISTRSEIFINNPIDYQQPQFQDVVMAPNQTVRFVLEQPRNGQGVHPTRRNHPQERIATFWANLEPEYKGGITQILPDPLVDANKSATSKAVASHAVDSYEHARARCVKAVTKIIKECRAQNQKYSDPHFDIEHDLKISGLRNCLHGLLGVTTLQYDPGDVQRVTEIFKNPQFYKESLRAGDVVQGLVGDCFLLAALSVLSANRELLDKVCVIQDQEVGVYGFCFYRDGTWEPCIIDDKLYLRAPSYDETDDTVLTKYNVNQKDEEKEYQRVFQTGSKSLFFAACSDENETWVPLLEKAYAKAHGDYAALSGGLTGEGIEDLTGGVTTEIYTTNILDKDRFWTESLSRTGNDFLFSCSDACYANWRLAPRNLVNDKIRDVRRGGIEPKHAYAVLDTYEGFGRRLVKLRNPWGHKEWAGAWSDGSREWTMEWLSRLKHTFGNDGVFWMEYEDFLRKFRYLDRTRLLDKEWHVAQKWAGVQVPWNAQGYQQTKFRFTLTEDSETVIVLQQLDTRYFKGLIGKYNYRLYFRIHRDDEPDEDDYIGRSPDRYDQCRSTSIELFLEKGSYTVLIRVEAWENNEPDIENIIQLRHQNRAKMITMATLYDLAHAKGRRPFKAKPPRSLSSSTHHTIEDWRSMVARSAQAANNDIVPSISEYQDAGDFLDDASQATSGQAGKMPRRDPQQHAPIDHPIPPLPLQSRTGPRQQKRHDRPRPGDHPAPKAPKVKPRPCLPPPPIIIPDIGFEDPVHKSKLMIPNDVSRRPFNAFCTVGLRVYSKISDLELRVVYHDTPDFMVPNLDRDDVARGVLDEVVREQQKETCCVQEIGKDNPSIETTKEAERADSPVMGYPDRGNRQQEDNDNNSDSGSGSESSDYSSDEDSRGR